MTHDNTNHEVGPEAGDVQAHFTLDLEGLRDPINPNGRKFLHDNSHGTKWTMFHGLSDIKLGPYWVYRKSKDRVKQINYHQLLGPS